MNERLRALRKKLGMNQTEFGEKIGVKQTTIAGYENGSRQPLDTVVNSICRVYDVNRNWLLTGKGEMFIIRLDKEKSAVKEYIEDLLAYTSNPPDPDNVNLFYEAIITALQNYHDMDETSKRCARELFRMRRAEVEEREDGDNK